MSIGLALGRDCRSVARTPTYGTRKRTVTYLSLHQVGSPVDPTALEDDPLLLRPPYPLRRAKRDLVTLNRRTTGVCVGLTLRLTGPPHFIPVLIKLNELKKSVEMACL